MSENKPSLPERFAANFYDRHEEWFEKHPKADAAFNVTVLATLAGYNILRLPDRTIRNAWYMATTPLEKFEPQHEGLGHEKPQPPYWQDLVFGDGRMEKLLARLDGLPQVGSTAQKWLLTTSDGGLRVLPKQRELLKYGLNDTVLLCGLRYLTMDLASRQDSNDPDFPAGPFKMTQDRGLVQANEAETPMYSQDWLRNNLMFAMHEIESVHGNKQNAAQVVDAVYIWLLEDVAPVIPNIFNDYKSTVQPDGSLRLDPQPKDYDVKVSAETLVKSAPLKSSWDYIPPDLIHPERKSLYEVLTDGYKGTLPVYEIAAPPKCRNLTP